MGGIAIRLKPGIILIGLFVSLVAHSSRALDILIGNDDGWQSAGLQALHDAMATAGHRVITVAPGGEQSASGTAFDLAGIRIRRETDDQYSVQVCIDERCGSLSPAEPATSVLVGIGLATKRFGRAPDLVLAGINLGANVGGMAQFSGTVGGVITAVSLPMGESLPAIAISTDPPRECLRDEACVARHMAGVADFGVKLVGHLASRARTNHEPLLPRGVALNVNYPPTTPKGVRVVRQGRAALLFGSNLKIGLECSDCATLEIGQSAEAGFEMASREDEAYREQSDSLAFGDGYVTIVPIEADYTADGWESLASWFKGFDANVSDEADGDGE